MVIADNCISDHSSVMFNIDLPAVISNNRSVDCYFHPVNEITAKRFAEAYESSPGPAIIEASGSPLDIEDLTALFNFLLLVKYYSITSKSCKDRFLLKAAVRNFFWLKIIRNQYLSKYITSQCSKLPPYFSPIHNG